MDQTTSMSAVADAKRKLHGRLTSASNDLQAVQDAIAGLTSTDGVPQPFLELLKNEIPNLTAFQKEIAKVLALLQPVVTTDSSAAANREAVIDFHPKFLSRIKKLSTLLSLLESLDAQGGIIHEKRLHQTLHGIVDSVPRDLAAYQEELKSIDKKVTLTPPFSEVPHPRPEKAINTLYNGLNGLSTSLDNALRILKQQRNVPGNAAITEQIDTCVGRLKPLHDYVKTAIENGLRPLAQNRSLNKMEQELLQHASEQVFNINNTLSEDSVLRDALSAIQKQGIWDATSAPHVLHIIQDIQGLEENFPAVEHYLNGPPLHALRENTHQGTARELYDFLSETGPYTKVIHLLAALKFPAPEPVRSGAEIDRQANRNSSLYVIKAIEKMLPDVLITLRKLGDGTGATQREITELAQLLKGLPGCFKDIGRLHAASDEISGYDKNTLEAAMEELIRTHDAQSDYIFKAIETFLSFVPADFLQLSVTPPNTAAASQTIKQKAQQLAAFYTDFLLPAYQEGLKFRLSNEQQKVLADGEIPQVSTPLWKAQESYARAEKTRILTHYRDGLHSIFDSLHKANVEINKRTLEPLQNIATGLNPYSFQAKKLSEILQNFDRIAMHICGMVDAAPELFGEQSAVGTLVRKLELQEYSDDPGYFTRLHTAMLSYLLEIQETKTPAPTPDNNSTSINTSDTGTNIVALVRRDSKGVPPKPTPIAQKPEGFVDTSTSMGIIVSRVKYYFDDALGSGHGTVTHFIPPESSREYGFTRDNILAYITPESLEREGWKVMTTNNEGKQTTLPIDFARGYKPPPKSRGPTEYEPGDEDMRIKALQGLLRQLKTHSVSKVDGLAASRS